MDRRREVSLIPIHELVGILNNRTRRNADEVATRASRIGDVREAIKAGVTDQVVSESRQVHPDNGDARERFFKRGELTAERFIEIGNELVPVAVAMIEPRILTESFKVRNEEKFAARSSERGNVAADMHSGILAVVIISAALDDD